MVIGYARVSTYEQNLDMQIDALSKYGVDTLYTEKISGKRARPVLEKITKGLASGDKLVVWKLDRLGRKTVELMELQRELEENNIALISITEELDTSTAIGKFAFQMLCCVAEMERNVISERTSAGLATAKSKGRIGGRKKGLTEEAEKKAELAKKLYLSRKNDSPTIKEICKLIGVARGTLYKYLRIKGVNIG